MDFLDNQQDEEKEIKNQEVMKEPATFADAGLQPQLLEAVEHIGWKTPTPVQQKCLPYTIRGRDVAGFAQTGTGKTGVFLLTIANRILQKGERINKKGNLGAPHAVILAPTRELAMQIQQDAENLLDKLGIKSLAVFGGVDYEKQARQIRDGIDVIVATPGRLKDYYQKKVLTLENCEQFVCDEADRMFDMGFIEDVEYFLDSLGENIQKLLFSATTNDQVKELAFEYLESPEYISVNPETMTPENIEQYAIICESKNKLKVMLGLLRDHNPTCAIIFANTKMVAEWLHYKLTRNGIDADLITGDLPQRKRINLITRIKEGKIKALIATDVASRGLHISNLSHVYNFDLPDDPANYVHRIGRTARAGAKGCSYSLVCEDYGQNLEPIKALLGDKLELKSEWHDDRYLSIVDQAGNPFKDPTFKGSTIGRERDTKPAQGRGDGRKGAQSGRGDGRPRHDRGGKGRRDEKPRDGQQQRQHHDGKERQDRGHHKDHKRGQRPQHDRPRHDRHQHHRHPDRPAAAASAQTASAAPTTVTGMIKKLFSVMFGRKKN